MQPKELKKNISDYRGDISTKKLCHSVINDSKPEIIFHLAAQPRVAFSVDDPVFAMRNNALVTSLMLNFCRKVGSSMNDFQTL